MPLRTYSVSPSYLAFTVPFGIDDYSIVFQRPYWQTVLSAACFVVLGLLAIASVFSLVSVKPVVKPEEKAPKTKAD